MRNFGVLLLIISSSLTNAYAQRLNPDSTDTIPQNQLSMIIPDDTCAFAFIDSLPPNFPWMDTEERGWVGWFPWFSDSNIALLTGTYTVIVTEPNPCVDTTLQVDFIDDPFICFTYPWIFPTVIGWSGGCLGVPAPDPFKGWHEIDLFGTDTAMHSSLSSFCATNSRQISSSPPSETPDPPQPAPIPEQPWYQAVLPGAVRVRKF